MVEHVAKETRAYLNCIAMVGISMAADIDNLQQQKRGAEQLLSSLGKHKGSESLTQQLISSLSADMKLLTDKITSNQLKPHEIGTKITNLFKEAQQELQ